MKLYLSSYYFSDQPTDFSNLIGDNKKVAIIMNDVVKYFINHNMTYKTLHDGEAIVIK